MIDYTIQELEPNEIPTKDVELSFFEECNLMSCIRFSRLEFENLKKVLDSLSLNQTAYGYETPYVGSDLIGRWKNGELEHEKVNLDCGVEVYVQIDGRTIILEFVADASRVSQDFTFKQWLRFKKRIAKIIPHLLRKTLRCKTP